MLTESGGWREEREQVISESGGGRGQQHNRRFNHAEKEVRKKKIPGGKGFRAFSYELSQSLVLQGKLPSSLQTCSKAIIDTNAMPC